MRSKPSRFTSFAALGLAAAVLPLAPASAITITSTADSWAQANQIPTGTNDRTTNNEVKTRDALATTNSGDEAGDRAGILRFDISPAAFSTSVGSSLTLEIIGLTGGGSSTISGTFFLFGVTETQSAGTPTVPDELTFTDGGGYLEGDADALDGVGNQVKEDYAFDANTVADPDRFIDTLVFDAEVTNIGDTITFSGSEFDDYLTSRLGIASGAGQDNAAFLLTFTRDGSSQAGDNRIEFFSNTTSSDLKPTLELVPEPASLVLIGLGSLMMVGRRRK